MAIFIKENDNNRMLAIKEMEHFIFTVFMLCRRQSNIKSTHIYKLANNYYIGEESGIPYDLDKTNQVIKDIHY